MAGPPDDGNRGLSRRELLKRAGFAGAAAAIAPAATLVPAQLVNAPPLGEALETLTAGEANTLEAIVARLIPTDANGPGAREARAAHYIDRALSGALSTAREAYRNGLAAVETYARAVKGAPFADLTDRDQDAVLTEMEKNAATGFSPNSSTFFNLLRTHTLQGTFGDPYYGGNANFVGWDLIGYPGIRLAVSESDQRLDRKLTPTHRSAYDHAMFSRKPSRASVTRRGHHGD
jgi:gluconate 2-dehydrogenase gamma chain